MTSEYSPSQLDYASKHRDSITTTTQLLSACQNAVNRDEYATSINNLFTFLIKRDMNMLVYFPSIRNNVRRKIQHCRALLCEQMNEGVEVHEQLLNNMLLIEKILVMIRFWDKYVSDKEEPISMAFSESAI